jgi:hypothetical protein
MSPKFGSQSCPILEWASKSPLQMSPDLNEPRLWKPQFFSKSLSGSRIASNTRRLYSQTCLILNGECLTSSLRSLTTGRRSKPVPSTNEPFLASPNVPRFWTSVRGNLSDLSPVFERAYPLQLQICPRAWTVLWAHWPGSWPHLSANTLKLSSRVYGGLRRHFAR